MNFPLLVNFPSLVHSNHTFASLDQTCDMNPFVHGEVPAEMRGEKYGFEREEAASFLAEQEKKGSEVKEEKKQ